MQPNKGFVYLIDSDETVRKSIAQLLRHARYTVYEFTDAKSFLKQSIDDGPAAIICEMSLSDLSAVQLQVKLKKGHCLVPMIVVCSRAEPESIVQVMKNGAIDVLFKPIKLPLLTKALEEAIAIEQKRVKTNAARSEVLERYKSLSPKEFDVCQHLVHGLLNIEIADIFGVTASTIKVQKSRVLQKMKVDSVPALSLLYNQHQLNKVKR